MALSNTTLPRASATVGLLVVLASATSASDSAQQDLKALLTPWVEKQIHFFTDSTGEQRLFVRRQPVRGKVYSTVVGLEGDIQSLIGLFSRFAGLNFEETNINPNIMAVVGSPINSGDTPNRDFLRRLGLPESAIELIAHSTGWSSGCGIYSFTGNSATDTDGQVTLSLALADARLPPEKIMDCMTEGIIRSFGMRANAATVIRRQDGFFQYLNLVAALRICDQKIGSNSAPKIEPRLLKQKYLDCSVEYLSNLNQLSGNER